MYSYIKNITLIFILIFCLSISASAENIHIIYTANINGMLENCGCGPDPLGGIGRVKSFVDQYISKHKNVMVIDGGDYFNSYPFPKLNEAMYSSLLLMHYDCLIPGDQSFVEGDSFFTKYATNLKPKILLTNSDDGVNNKITKDFGPNQIIVYGYLSPYIFEFIPKPENLNLKHFVNAKPEPLNKNQFQIAVVHGYLSNAEQFAVENSTVTLILLAHDQRKGIWKKNQATIIGNGKDSEYISVVKMDSDDQWNFTAEQYKIHEDLPEDEQIVKIIADYKTN